MKKQKIGLIQIDGKMPNLALMKLAKWHRDKGDDVRIIDLSSLGINKWYGSKIFMGGSGYDIKQTLPKDIEAQVPDYELFNFAALFNSFPKISLLTRFKSRTWRILYKSRNR